MRTTSVLTFVALFAGAAPCLAQAKAVVVPFTLLPSRHMAIDVKVNGKGPYKLIFDTGAPLNLMSKRLTKAAGLTKKRGGGFGFGLFGGVRQVEIDTLQVGGATAKNLPAVAMDHPTVQAISDAFEEQVGRIDGIVGFPFFARFATTVDYQKKQLTLRPTDYKPGDYLQDLAQSLLTAGERKSEPRVVGAAGLWGFVIEKPKGDAKAGVVVKSVFAKTPAATGGLKPGDRVLTIDGRWTDTVGDAYIAASLVKSGRAVDVVVQREGKETTLSITPKKGY